MADTRLEIILSAKDQTRAAFSSLKNELSGLGTATSKTGSALTSIGSQMATAAVAGGAVLAAGLAAVVKQASGFEQQMSAVGAASQASAGEMGQLHDLALDLGKDLQLSGVGATEAAQAMEELAKGGVTVGEQLGGATKGALLLFSAGAKSVEEASGIAVKAMNLFGLSGGDVAHVADLMAAGASKSATDVSALGQAFNQSAAVAKGAGLSIEELTGTLAFLAQRGLDGSDAGTSLKTALLALQAPTDVAAATMKELGINVRDANGDMLPFAQIAQILQDRLSGLSAAQRDAALKTIFGNDAIRVGLALYEGGGAAIADWTDKVNDAGFAARIGAQRNDNLAGSVSQLMATIQTGAIVFGEKFIPVARKATDEATKFVQSLADSPAVQRALDDLAANASRALDQLITKLKDPAFQNQMREWGRAALDAGTAIRDLAGSLANTLGPVLLGAARWFSGLDEGGKSNVVTFGLVAAAAGKFRSELSTLLSVGGSVIRMFAEKEAAKKTLTGANNTLATSAGKTATAFGAVKAAIGTALVAFIAGDLAIRALTKNNEDLISFTGSILKYGDALHKAREEAAAFLTEHRSTSDLAAYDAEIAKLTKRYNELSRESAQYADISWASIRDLPNAFARELERGNLEKQIETLRNYRLGVQETNFALEKNLRIQAGLADVQGPYTIAMLQQAVAMKQAEEAARNFIGPVQALGPTLPAMALGFNLAAVAAGNLAVPAQATGLALADLNSYGTTAQSTLNSLAGELITVTSQTNGAALALAIAEQDTGEFGTAVGVARDKVLGLTTAFNEHNAALAGLNSENSRLGGYLQTLQAEWDALNVATENGKHVTADQKAEYERLAPAIQYLNGVMGVNHAGIVDNTLALVDLDGKLKAAGVSLGIASDIAVNTYGKALADGKTQTEALQLAIQAAGGSAQTASGTIGTIGKALDNLQFGTATIAAKKFELGLKDIPSSVKTDITTPGLSDATIGVRLLQTAINEVPPSFTVTAHVDISGALADIQTLSNNMPHSPAKEGPFRTLPNWAALFESWGPALDAAIKAFEGWGNDVAKKGAETVSSVSKAITDAIGASSALAKVDSGNGPSGAQLGWLRETTAALVATMRDAAQSFNEEGLKAAGDYADTASKVGGSIKNTLEGLAALASAKWAEISPSGSALGWFTHLASALVRSFADAAAGFEDGATGSAGQLGEAAGKVGGSIRSTLEGLAALASAKWADISPSGSALGWFTFLAKSLVQSYAQAASELAEGTADAASKLGESVGKVAGSIGPAITGLKELATGFPAPNPAQLDAFFAGVRQIMARFGAMAAELSTEGIKQVNDYGAATNTVVGAAKAATDLFKAFAPDDKGRGLVIPSAQGLNQLAEGIKYVVRKFQEMAATLQGEALAAVTAYATGVGTIVGAAKSAADLFKTLGETKNLPDTKVIDYLVGLIGYTITQTRAIATGIGEEGMRQAQAFADDTLLYVATLKAAFQLFNELDKYKEIPAKMLDQLNAQMVDVLDWGQKLWEQSEALKAVALSFADNMREAARAFASGLSMGAGLASTAPLLAAPAGVGGGFGGFDSLRGGGERVVNLNMYGDVYDTSRFEDRIVATIETATRKGRV